MYFLKHRNRNILSFVLILSMMLSMFSIGDHTYAQEHSVPEVEDSDPIKEAMEDAAVPERAGDWRTAREDGASWGEFHYAVQDHIIKQYENVEKEVEVILEEGKDGKKDKVGRIDLLSHSLPKEKRHNYGYWKDKIYCKPAF